MHLSFQVALLTTLFKDTMLHLFRPTLQYKEVYQSTYVNIFFQKNHSNEAN